MRSSFSQFLTNQFASEHFFMQLKRFPLCAAIFVLPCYLRTASGRMDHSATSLGQIRGIWLGCCWKFARPFDPSSDWTRSHRERDGCDSGIVLHSILANRKSNTLNPCENYWRPSEAIRNKMILNAVPTFLIKIIFVVCIYLRLVFLFKLFFVEWVILSLPY